MDEQQVKFRDLGSLLYDDVGTGILATAIEQHGIQGWDRYDRFVDFRADSSEARSALDLLAAQAAWSRGEPDDTPSPLEAAVGPDNPFARYGWAGRKVPDFGAIEAGQAKVSRPQSEVRSENANLAIIGYLLAFVRGELPPRKRPHPEFKSDAELIRRLSVYQQDVPGLSERSLEGKFAEAKRRVKIRDEPKPPQV